MNSTKIEIHSTRRSFLKKEKKKRYSVCLVKRKFSAHIRLVIFEIET